jgi:hypothetical protein
MKRELVVFSVIGGLLWVATGFSVLAVTFLDTGTHDSMVDQALMIGESDPGPALADAKNRDEGTSAPLCEAAPSAPATPELLQGSNDRCSDVRVIDGETVRCWHHEAISLLQRCLLLT